MNEWIQKYSLNKVSDIYKWQMASSFVSLFVDDFYLFASVVASAVFTFLW